jgi:hypothetical protein
VKDLEKHINDIETKYSRIIALDPKLIEDSLKAEEDNCHSPTQPQHELELDLIMGRNPPPTTPPTGTFKALPGKLGS